MNFRDKIQFLDKFQPLLWFWLRSIALQQQYGIRKTYQKFCQRQIDRQSVDRQSYMMKRIT
jgi:hypothetical protein